MTGREKMTIPTPQQAKVPEFSRPVAVEGIIPDKPRFEKIAATEEEAAALAKRFELQSLSGLKANITILRVSDGKIIRVEGDFEAEVVQTCVVSLQGVSAEIKAHFDSYFTEAGESFHEDEDFSLELDEDPEEVFKNGMLDIGELVAQHLSLELDPYPRAPGVSLAAQLSEAGAEVKNRPFQVLQDLKSDKED
jgi:uncharacterized metal-binding protein YceD (DUF177 family)